MRSHSPLLSPNTYKQSVNFLTPSRNKHFSQISTGPQNFTSPQSEVTRPKRDFMLITPGSAQNDKQKNIQTANNYFRQGSQSRGLQESPAKILFKNGYEQQEEIKRLNQENKNLKEIIQKQEEQLKQFLELGDVIEQNRKLQEQVAKVEQENRYLKELGGQQIQQQEQQLENE